MSVIKKFLFRTILFVVCILNSLAWAAWENDDSGRAHIINIMSNEETGISAYNKKNVHYVELLNLEQDLNTSEIAKRFPCMTLMGQAFLAETLKVPVSPGDKNSTQTRSVLHSRQDAIRVLVENPSLKKEVECFLENAKGEECNLVELMSDTFMARVRSDLKGLAEVKKEVPKVYPIVNFMERDPIARSFLYYLGLSSSPWSVYYTYGRMQSFARTKEVHLRKDLFAVLTVVQAVWGTYNFYRRHKRDLIRRLKVHSLSQLITSAENLEFLCGKYGINLQFKFSRITHPQGKKLLRDLKHKRYQSKNTLFFQAPLMDIVLYEICENSQYLAEVFASIAELDAYNAIATKMLESQNTRNKLCFANFVDSEKPVIRSESFWNILVKNAVPSSISEDHQMILTGPNAGGKTTAIRALLQNVVFAQTFGIAAAESFEFTMFDVIHSYINISDDILNGLSLFASEVKRAQEILQSIKSLGTTKKFFFALDELFTGTAAEDGEKCAYEFVKRLASFDRVQFLYATHFDKLKELGNSHVRCENYKVDAPTKGVDGKFVYPYTLSPGASNVKIGLEIAQQANLFSVAEYSMLKRGDEGDENTRRSLGEGWVGAMAIRQAHDKLRSERSNSADTTAFKPARASFG